MPLHVLEDAAGLHDALVVLTVFLGEFLGEEIEIGLADDVAGRLAQRFAKQLVGEGETTQLGLCGKC